MGTMNGRIDESVITTDRKARLKVYEAKVCTSDASHLLLLVYGSDEHKTSRFPAGLLWYFLALWTCGLGFRTWGIAFCPARNRCCRDGRPVRGHTVYVSCAASWTCRVCMECGMQ